MQKINAKDLLLLRALRDNGRETLTAMSKQTSIPISTIHEKIKKYNEQLVKKHTVLLDFPRLGYTCHAKLLVNSTKEEKAALQEHLQAHPNVNNIYELEHENFFLDVLFKNMADLDLWTEGLNSHGATDVKTFFVTNELKREGVLTKEQ